MQSLTGSRSASKTNAMSEAVTLSGTSLRERTAEEIRVLLARRHISAAELARRTGMKQPYISRRMTGEVAWDVDDLERIAAVLDVDVIDLMPQREGKLIAVGGATRTPARESKPWNVALTKRPGPNGPPGRNTPAPSTRRTGRISPALAAA